MCQIWTPERYTHLPTRINLMQTVGRFGMWVTPETKRPHFCLLKPSHALGIVCSVCYLGCMVVNINVLFAEWRITEHDYIQILLLGILSGMQIEPTIFIYFQIYIIDAAVTATYLCFGKYVFPNFRLALLIVLRAFVHLIIYLVIFNNFLVFDFPFL